MLGLGETDEDIRRTIRDLLDNGVDIVTFGQYLRYIYFVYVVVSCTVL